MYYAYIEASSQPSKSVAILAIPLYQYYSCLCLRFDYHMFGQDIGSLEIVTQGSTKYGTTIWDRRGRAYFVSTRVLQIFVHSMLLVLAQGNFWNSAEIEIKNSQVTLVCIQATKGYGIYGDIAVDNVYLLGRCCTLPTTTTTTPPPPPASTTTTLAPSNSGLNLLFVQYIH